MSGWRLKCTVHTNWEKKEMWFSVLGSLWFSVLGEQKDCKTHKYFEYYCVVSEGKRLENVQAGGMLFPLLVAACLSQSLDVSEASIPITDTFIWK